MHARVRTYDAIYAAADSQRRRHECTCYGCKRRAWRWIWNQGITCTIPVSFLHFLSFLPFPPSPSRDSLTSVSGLTTKVIAASSCCYTRSTKSVFVKSMNTAPGGRRERCSFRGNVVSRWTVYRRVSRTTIVRFPPCELGLRRASNYSRFFQF